MDIKLKFPPLNDGQESGISDSGIETFIGKSLESLAKEILQNSLDAKYENNIVKVSFELLELDRTEIPEIDALEKTLERCLEFREGNEKASKYLKKGLHSVQGDRISVLKVSDYGTVGLTNPDKDRNSNFYNLVKSSGVSDKGSQAGGSFGIGKNAPFSCSLARTLFYSTKTIDNQYAFQGVSRLVTHIVDGEKTQGVGYIGNPDKNSPILSEKHIPKAFLRDEVGTDIYIIGFNVYDDWESQVIKASIENFFESVLENKVEIKVGKILVNKETLQDCFDKYYTDEKNGNAYHFYNCLILNDIPDKRVIKKDFIDTNNNNLGEIELHLLRSKEAPNRIAFLRNTGMKIIEKGNFRTTLSFSGVIKFNGEGINSFIRSIETPAHDKFEPKRVDDENNNRYAQKNLDLLNKFLRDSVNEFSQVNDEDEINIQGLGKYLPDDSQEEKLLEYSLKKGKVKSITLERYENKKNKQKKNDDENGLLLDILDINMIEELGEIIDSDTDEQEESNYISLSEPTTESEGKGNSAGNSEGTNIKQESSINGNKRVLITKKRVFINDSIGKEYRVILESKEDCDLYLSLKSHYDTSKEIVNLEKATYMGNSLNIINHKIIEMKLEANKRAEIFCTLKEEIWSEMEVSLNAK